MNFKKLIAAVSTVAMLGSLVTALPASAADDYVASTTATWTAKECINATDSNIKIMDGDHKTDVRMTPVTATTDPDNHAGAKIGVFKLGSVKAGEKIDITVHLWTANNDLNGIGLYTTDSEVSKTVDTDAEEVMKGTALAPLGTISAPSKTVNPYQVSKTIFTANVTAGNGKLEWSNEGTATFSTQITEENAGYLYFIAGGWGGTSRLIQIKDISVTYSEPTLQGAVDRAQENGTVTLLKNATSGSRVTISKNLTITSENKTITCTSTTQNAVLINEGKSLVINNTNITDTVSGKYALTVAKGGSNVTVNGGVITGGIYQENGNNTAITLNGVTVNGGVKTRKGIDTAAGNTSCKVTINNSIVDELYYNSVVDGEYVTDGKSTISKVADSNVHFNAVIDQASVVSENGTGDLAEQTAVGFLATITGNGTVSAIDVAVNDQSKGAQSLPDGTEITLANGSSALVGIIVDGINTVVDVTVIVK